MTRIAILGGGISGLTAAYELELARRAGAPIDWHLYEASNRLGGIIETTRHETPEGTYILEGGPDGWVSEKPWARDLAIELGFEGDLITSNDATRKTYILQQNRNTGEIAGKLQPIPDRMRLMVPEDLSALEGSPLFSDSARAAYANELANAAQLKAVSPFADAAYDESVATFVLRHFGEEVLTKLAAPLLSGVFGGDVAKLSARAVMPQFVAMERDHGSLIAGLQAKTKQCGNKPAQTIFTSLRHGMASLTEALVAVLPVEHLHLNKEAQHLWLDEDEWNIDFFPADELTLKRRFGADSEGPFNNILVTTSLDTTRNLVGSFDPVSTTLLSSRGAITSLLPTDASSAILVTFTWPAETARTFTIPLGFGFLVPLSDDSQRLLACTFVDQKFPHRAPPGARILRAFFGGPSAEALATEPDTAIAALALTQLRAILGPIPEPAFTTLRRWPRSLPQYEVGHIERMAQLDALVATIPGLTLLGNSYHGVGLPDLIHAARKAARGIAQAAAGTPRR